MKRLAVTLIVLFVATSLFAGGGKDCNYNKNTKTVELTGTLARADEGGKTVFRVSDGGESYVVCSGTKASLLKLGADNATIRVKGKLVSCGESEGQELVITEAKKI